VFLISLVVTCASCAAAPGVTSSSTPKVLGQQSGSPTVVGQPAPAGTGDLSATSCADASHCWAVGVPDPNATTATTTAPKPATVIVATANGGRTWSSQSVTLNPTPALTGIACPKVKDCMAVGSTGSDPGAGAVMTSHDGGHSWVQATSPAGAVAVASVQCTTSADCTALVSDGTSIFSASTVNFGRAWVQGGTLPAGLGGALDLWCGVSGTCLVAGYTPTTAGHGQGAVAISANGGTTWTAATVPTGVGVLQAASCLSTSRCLAGGTTSTTVSDVVPAKGLLLLSTNGGHSWSAVPGPQPVNDIFALGCPSATGCAMSGTNWSGTPTIGTGAVAETSNAGATVTLSTTAYAPLTLTSMACPTPESCVAAGGDTLARITLPVPAKSSHS
jgi:hypothetical protein